MSTKKKEFRVIKLAQKLCSDIVEMQGTADRRYRYTICQDVRKKSEDIIHLTRKANSLPPGMEARIELQEEADDKLEDIKDLIGVVGKLLNSGVKKEAQIELSLENFQKKLHNWMESDQKISVSIREKAVRSQAWTLYQAKRAYEIVNDYHHTSGTERTAIALDESKSRYRLARKRYEELIEEYDMAVKRLRQTQERFHKDDSVLCEVLKQIEKETGVTVPDPKDAGLSEKDISEKQKLIREVNGKVASENPDFAESTKYKLIG